MKLAAGPSGKKKDREIVRQTKQFAHQSFCFRDYRFEFLAPVRYFQQRKTGILVINHGFCRLGKYFAGQNRRASVKVVLLHWVSSLMDLYGRVI